MRIGDAVEHCPTVESMSQLGELLAQHRGISARSAGQLISNWAVGRRSCPPEYLVWLSNTLGVTTDFLLGVSADPKKGQFG